MTYLIDSGFLYATLDRNDVNHLNVIKVLPNLQNDNIYLPIVVLVEVAYLLQGRLGHHQMRQFISTLENSPLEFEPITKADTKRIFELLEEYSDNQLDFVDASITAIAERLNIQRILTVDQRDFRIIRPNHCDYFEIIP